MTTFAAQQDTERRRAELDARTRSAWAEYRDALRGLEGRSYADVEAASWEQLQATLREIDGERADLSDAGSPR